jgi:hypothetical protein
VPADSDLPSSSIILDTSDSSLDLPELIDQRSAVDSSSERDDSSNFSLEDEFEISNFGNFEINDLSILPQHLCHNFNILETSNMESDCLDP